MAILAKMAEMELNRQNRQIVNKNSNSWQRGPLESGDFGQNRVFGENGRNGNYSPKSPNCKQNFKLDGKRALWKLAISSKMVYLAKMAGMAINRQNRQTINKN